MKIRAALFWLRRIEGTKVAQSGEWSSGSNKLDTSSDFDSPPDARATEGKTQQSHAEIASNSGDRHGAQTGANGVTHQGNDRPGIADGPDGESSKSRNKRRRNRRRKRRGGGGAAQQQAQNTAASTAPADLPTQPAPNLAKAPEPEATETAGATADKRLHVPRQYGSQTAYAALDLGTNNCRLLVAVPTKPGSFRVIDAFSRIVRLGEGFGASGRLSQAAMDRAVEALKVCRDKLYSRPIQRARLIATEACRSAENGAEFLERVYDETGLALEVVDRETEARLAVSGCASLVDRAAKSVVLFDIGGGSSEIALVNAETYRGGRLADHISAWTSLPVGVVTMAEKFGGRDVTVEKFNAMIDHATQLLQSHSNLELVASMVGGSANMIGDDFHLIGTSGTVTTLAGIHLDLPRYDRRQVDGLWMSSLQVDKINKQLLDWTFEERAANACIGKDRADLVLAGCAILEAIRKVWPSERLRVADRGLREGLLTEMMATDGVWRRRNRKNNRNRRNKNRGGH